MEEELKSKLASLRDCVEQSEGMEEGAKEKILSAVGDLEEQFQEYHPGLLESLEESVLKAEAAHPKLTAVLQQISDALSKMGI